MANDYVMNDKLVVHEKYLNNATTEISRGPVPLSMTPRACSSASKHARAHTNRVARACSATKGKHVTTASHFKSVSVEGHHYYDTMNGQQ